MNHSGNFGFLFAEFFKNCIKDLVSSDFKREKNPGAPFRFGENHLRKHIRMVDKNQGFKLPPEWPPLFIERKVNNDKSMFGRNHGGIDYFFVKEATDKTYDLNDLLATCEMKGPTRRKMLEGSKVNWYGGVLRDIQKQVSRAIYAPNVEHYCCILVRPLDNSDVKKDFGKVLECILEETKIAAIAVSSWVQLEEVAKLNIVILRILPKLEAQEL